MKKIIVTATAAAFFGSATLAPTPASAWVFLLIPAVFAKEYKADFKAQNPYAKATKVKKSKKRG